MLEQNIHEEVQRYYGETLTSSTDLKTSACCTIAAPPEHVKPIFAELHAEVLTRYYGCGLVLPEALEGASVLDLGCGAGRDCYILSRLVGASGRVVGVDMTPAQLAVARRHRDYHAQRFGYASSNVEFVEGNIEALEETGLPDQSFDVIVSNCVLNLAVDKAAVLRNAFRLLKPGGEMYFADIYTDRRVPAELAADPVLYGECLGGAMYWNDFQHAARAAGFTDPRLVTDRPVEVTDPALAKLTGNLGFWSATYRLFRIDELEPDCEDYGEAVEYLGTVTGYPEALVLDKHHLFRRGKVEPVCGNTRRMLAATRLAPHFRFYGSGERHFGIFPGCGGGLPFDTGQSGGQGTACC